MNAAKSTLTTGHYENKALQKDWDEYGADKFVSEILEEVQVNDNPSFNLDDELTLLEMVWLEKLQPFGERGYNTDAKIRQV